MTSYCKKTGSLHNVFIRVCQDCGESQGPELVGEVLERVFPVPQEGCGAGLGQVCEWAPTGECDDCKGRRNKDEYVQMLADAIVGALPEGVEPSTIYIKSQNVTFPEGSPIVVEDQEIPLKPQEDPQKT